MLQINNWVVTCNKDIITDAPILDYVIKNLTTGLYEDKSLYEDEEDYLPNAKVDEFDLEDEPDRPVADGNNVFYINK